MNLFKLQLLFLSLIVSTEHIYAYEYEKAPAAHCNGYEQFWVKDQNGCKHRTGGNLGLRLKWTGKCLNGYASGYGVAKIYKYMKSINKDAVYERYTGTKIKGVKSGHATYLWSFSAHKYVGGFVDGQKEGKAKHTWFYRDKKNDYSYEGEYKCNDKFGAGIEISRDGVISQVYNTDRRTVTATTKISSNTSHSHADRHHSHPFPAQGVNHNHGGAYGVFSKVKNEASLAAQSKDKQLKQKKTPINCNKINIEEEKVACYAVIVGPKACTEAITENEYKLSQSIGGRIALSAACTKGIYSVYAKEYVDDDLLWNAADEISESACENRKDGGFLKWAAGSYGCVFSGLSWGLKFSTAHNCVENIKAQCE